MSSASLGIKFRQGRPADIDAIVALDSATESAPHWQRSLYGDALNSGMHGTPRRRVVVAARPDGLVVGFSVASVHSAPLSSAELESVAVAAHARRSGVGRGLCTALIDWCLAEGAAGISLEVRAQNAGAIALYASLNFSQTAYRPGYYSHPSDDAIVLHRDLTISSEL